MVITRPPTRHPTSLHKGSGSVSGRAAWPNVQREIQHLPRSISYTDISTYPMDPDGPVAVVPASPPIWRWVLSFLAVGACWGLTTPFMRRAAVIRDKRPKQQRPYLTSEAPWISRKIWSILYAVMDLLRNPAYAIPLLLNVTGSVRKRASLLYAY